MTYFDFQIFFPPPLELLKENSSQLIFQEHLSWKLLADIYCAPSHSCEVATVCYPHFITKAAEIESSALPKVTHRVRGALRGRTLCPWQPSCLTSVWTALKIRLSGILMRRLKLCSALLMVIWWLHILTLFIDLQPKAIHLLDPQTKRASSLICHWLQSNTSLERQENAVTSDTHGKAWIVVLQASKRMNL